MAKFKELIKKYDKIRPYLRDFLVYGTKGRGNYDLSSRRSYDNERRRIENYLSHYVSSTMTPTGKNLYINKDSLHIHENPFFDTYKTKSFTKNDVFLHFTLLDILNNQSLDISAICNQLPDYLDEDYDFNLPDTMTVRNKLNEYFKLGLLNRITKGRKSYYSLANSLTFTKDHEEDLLKCLHFFQNTAYIGIIGNYMEAQLLNNFGEEDTHFSFKHVYDSHILDYSIVLQIFNAMRNNNSIKLETNQSSGFTYDTHVVPIQILNNLETGRQYLASYHLNEKRLCLFRLDRIHTITIQKLEASRYDYFDKLDVLLNQSFGVNLPSDTGLESVTLELYILEKSERYILDRLNREGLHGVVEHIDKHTFRYTIKVIDANEMLPWIRTFIGRIISFSSSNTEIVRRFYDDLYHMKKLYDL